MFSFNTIAIAKRIKISKRIFLGGIFNGHVVFHRMLKYSAQHDAISDLNCVQNRFQITYYHIFILNLAKINYLFFSVLR